MSNEITVMLCNGMLRYKLQYNGGTLLKDILYEHPELIRNWRGGGFQIDGASFKPTEWENKLNSTIGSIADGADKVWITYIIKPCGEPWPLPSGKDVGKFLESALRAYKNGIISLDEYKKLISEEDFPQYFVKGKRLSPEKADYFSRLIKIWENN